MDQRSANSAAEMCEIMAKQLFSLYLCMFLFSCASDNEKKLVEPIPSQRDIKKPETLKKSLKTDKPHLKTSPSEETCIAFSDDIHNKMGPIWLNQPGIVITKFIKSCTTKDGKVGYENFSPWIAMGFPCTGGKGKIDIRGNQWAPQIVSFVLSTDCPMQQKITEVEEQVKKSLHLSQKAKLLAFNPFATQYWELPGLADADTGFTIDLRSPQAKQQTWQKFLNDTPIPVKLYGRENSWASDNHIYEVSGEIVKTKTMQFRLNIKNVKVLNTDEITAIRQRCESVRARRGCNAIL